MKALLEAFYRLLELDVKELDESKQLTFHSLCRKYFALEADCKEVARQIDGFIITRRGE